jgi:hypothetical protein
MSDVNENLRAAVNMVSRDLSQAGQNIPVGGIPIPSSGGTAINRPGPTGTPAFPTSTTNISAVTPGYQMGRTQGSGTYQYKTDIVTIIGVNQFSPFNQTAVNTTSPNQPTISSTSATITVSTTAAGNVSLGQLIMLTNINSSCLLAVSSVNTSTGVITFKNGDANDTLGVNQFPTLSANGTITAGPTSGTILQLETATTNGNTTTYTWPAALTAYPISMTTYYLDNTNPGGRLMKQIIMGAPQPVALGINVMTIAYTCSSGTSPTRNPSSPNSIQKAAVTMIAETDHQNQINAQWYSKSITNAVAVQNLDFSNKYSLHASTTQN